MAELDLCVNASYVSVESFFYIRSLFLKMLVFKGFFLLHQMRGPKINVLLWADT